MSGYRELYHAHNLPVFQNRMFDSADAALHCVRGDVTLVQDLRTGLIYNNAFRPELMEYGTDYQNEQAVSEAFRRHLDDVGGIVARHLQGQSLIEVGCGKGYFLEQLRARGFKITGLDPTYEGSDPQIIKEYFTPAIGLHADGIILRHVLEHIQDPVRFLEMIREANGGTGKIYIEVPCFDWICEHRAWFDVFYEHVNYFRLHDFDRMFGTVHESGHTFGGQYLFVVADLSTIHEPTFSNSSAANVPDDFVDTIARHAELLKASASPDNGRRRAAVWGGASKGVIFSLFMQRAGADVSAVIDINPAKQGRYLPATGLQVQPPGAVVPLLTPDAQIFVMNGNYLPEIRALTGDRFTYRVIDQQSA